MYCLEITENADTEIFKSQINFRHFVLQQFIFLISSLTQVFPSGTITILVMDHANFFMLMRASGAIQNIIHSSSSSLTAQSFLNTTVIDNVARPPLMDSIVLPCRIS